jgi:hypothetical protein
MNNTTRGLSPFGAPHARCGAPPAVGVAMVCPVDDEIVSQQPSIAHSNPHPGLFNPSPLMPSNAAWAIQL